jgi:hypothetical protein
MKAKNNSFSGFSQQTNFIQSLRDRDIIKDTNIDSFLRSRYYNLGYPTEYSGSAYKINNTSIIFYISIRGDMYFHLGRAGEKWQQIEQVFDLLPEDFKTQIAFYLNLF